MRILFAEQELADFYDPPASQVRLNGAIVFDEVTRPRAASTAFYARANSKNTVEFDVRHEFATIAECEKFALTHFDSLTKEGTLLLWCGENDDDEDDVVTGTGVLASCSASYQGVSCRLTYTVHTGVLAAAEPAMDELGDTGGL
jgi:hypothetical protein